MIEIADGDGPRDGELPFESACRRALTESWNGAPPVEGADEGIRSLLDTLRCTVGGVELPSVAEIRDALGIDACGVVNGARNGVPAPAAAFANALAAHAQDLDDTQLSTTAHVSSVVWGALLASADARTPGAALLDARRVGTRFSSRLGAFVVPRHLRAGWHATATVGAFAATVAVVRLLGGGEQRAWDALGIVGSLISGLRANTFGGLKAFHAGRAAENAVTAARLATVAAVAQGGSLAAAGEVLGFERAARLLPPGGTDDLAVKAWPTCSGTHAPIAAALRLRDTWSPDAGEVLVPGLVLEETHDDWPMTLPQARLGLRYVVAVALVHGTVDERTLADGMSCAHTATQFERLTVRRGTGWDDRRYRLAAVVRLRGDDGSEREAAVGAPYGAELAQPTWEEVAESTRTAVARAWGGTRADRLIAAAIDLPGAPSAEDLLAAASRAAAS